MINATKKWIFLKISGATLVPLMLWFIINLINFYDQGYSEVVNFFTNSPSKFLFSIFIINAYFFSALSISEVFEDYITNDKNKNVANISRHLHGKRKKRLFSQAPCISQAPFHVPIRGGYQGGARLSRMDCSDTTQSLQVSLEGQFKKSFLGLSSSIQEVGKLFLVSPQNTNS